MGCREPATKVSAILTETVGRYRGEQPRRNVSMMIMRPRRGVARQLAGKGAPALYSRNGKSK